jgi:ubiquinone/menaquinone biosynthesis C-methylase UbiE
MKKHAKEFGREFDQKAGCLQKEELKFWECQKKSGDEMDLKLARDLPDDTPDFILQLLSDFERDAAKFCFSGAKGRILDAGCGNGNLALRALRCEMIEKNSARFIGMDFSRNMLRRAAWRARDDSRTGFLRGSVSHLPFQDQSFDWVVSSGVLTCLPTFGDAELALSEFYRVLKPGGIMVVDFFNSRSHFTLVRRHLLRETIAPPEYMTPSHFRTTLARAGFEVIDIRGFDFKLVQGYLFSSRFRPLIDPYFVQERVSRFLEASIVPRMPVLSLFGYRNYVKCRKA